MQMIVVFQGILLQNRYQILITFQNHLGRKQRSQCLGAVYPHLQNLMRKVFNDCCLAFLHVDFFEKVFGEETYSSGTVRCDFLLIAVAVLDHVRETLSELFLF